MKILVTGSTGFVGWHLLKALLEKEYEVHTIIRRESDASRIDTKAKIFRYDEDINTLVNYFQDESFDGVIHLASLFLATHEKENIAELINSNIKFGTELLEASKIARTKWFINTGTFWQNYNNEAYNPVNLYAATKEAFENIAKYYVETSDLIFTTIKLNDTFGPNDTRNKVFNLWSKIAKTGETLEMSAGEQLIEVSYIEDIVNAYILLIGHLDSDKAIDFNQQAFVVKSDKRLTLRELSKVFEEVACVKLNIKWGARPYREREVMLPWENGVNIPGWKQNYTLQEAIKKMIEEN